jgi:hypothetical protein
MNIQFFVVFHSNLFDECYADIPKDILDKYFTFMAVNETIPKKYTENKYKVIKEWELPIYDKTFQERGYNENSVLHHIYENKLHSSYDWIGFFQYDMEIPCSMIENIEQGISTRTSPFYYALFLLDFHKTTFTSWNDLESETILQEYENFFKTPFSKDELYPLYNTYVLPIEIYEKIMKWVSTLYEILYPKLIQTEYFHRFSKVHIGAVYERIMGYAIAQEKLPHILLQLHHNHAYKNMSYS